MKHTSKRLQALVLVLAMCVSFLQIPSFALTEGTHTSEYTVSNVTISKDGSFTVAEKCSNHKDATTACNEVSGKIATKTENGALTLDAANCNIPKLLCGKDVTVDFKSPVATCSEAGKATYIVNIEGMPPYTYAFVSGTATGKHDYQTQLPGATSSQALYDELIADTTHYSLVSDAATCEADGDAVFAQKCPTCGHVNENEKDLVKVKHKVDHTYIKDEADKTGKTDKIYTEELAAPTCKGEGLAIEYKVCKFCKNKFYINADGKLTTAKSQAKQNIVPKLNHTFKYTVKASRPATVGKTLSKDDFYVDSECTACKDENATDWQADPIKAEVVADKTVAPKFDCTVGSQTYKVTYEVTDFTKKDANGNFGTKELTEEVTVDYYPANYVGHKWGDIYVPDEDSVVKATCTKDGHYNLIDTCSVCGEKYIYATIKIPATGKHTAAAAKKENVVAATTKKGGSYDLVVRCADCGEIISSTHKTTAKIVVKASKINSVKNYKGKKAKITVKKAASVTGYQIQYGTKKNFKGAKSVKTKATTKTVSKLAKKKYYVRVRTYKVVSGKTYYSSWSGAKTVTIKK